MRGFIAGLLCGVWLNGVAAGSTITAPILYRNFDRVSFPYGTDVHIYSGCRFAIVEGDSTVVSGEIEISRPGISISRPITALDSLVLDSGMVAVIDRFEVDSAARVRIGLMAYLPVERVMTVAGADSRFAVVEAVPYQNQLKMLYDYEAGRLDGFVTDYAPRLEGVASECLSSAAAWVVALAPNPASALVQDGMVTTSLFYRFDPVSLPLITDGDSAVAWFALTDDSTQNVRRFPFDPETGRRLLRNLRSLPHQLVLGVENESLTRPAAFFADVLARDRITTKIADTFHGADLKLVSIPLEAADDTVSLRYLIEYLAADTTAGMPINEAIAQAASHLAAASRQPDSSLRAAALQRAVRKLIDDGGVFPLFRPGLFLTYRSTIGGISVDPNSRFDLTHISVLIPPPYLRDRR